MGTSYHEPPALFWLKWFVGYRKMAYQPAMGFTQQQQSVRNRKGWCEDTGRVTVEVANWQLYLEKCNLIPVRHWWYFWHPSFIFCFQSLLGDVKQNYFCIHFAFVITAVKSMMYEHCLFLERQQINFITPVEKFGDGVTKHLMIKENSE